jgi:small-conductance mechanosensitive channel
MDFFAVTPQLEDFQKQFPGWPTVLLYAAIYIAVGIVLYFIAKVFVRRLIRRQATKFEASLTVPLGPGRERALESGRRRLAKVQVAILRVVKVALMISGFILLIGDLFPTLDMLSGSLSILILGGTALGLAGAMQPFIRDIIGGSLLFFEDAYAVGDFVKVAGVEGTVEELHLRRTVIRSHDGSVHIVPNGAVGVATNMSRVWATSTVEIVLAHDVELDTAIALADATAASLAEDPDWSDRLIEAPRVARVSDVSPDGVTIRLAGRVVTGEAGPVAGELRRRLHHAYLEAGIPLARRHDAVLAHPAAGGAAGAKAKGKTAPVAATTTRKATTVATEPVPTSTIPDPRAPVSDPRGLSSRR